MQIIAEGIVIQSSMANGAPASDRDDWNNNKQYRRGDKNRPWIRLVVGVEIRILHDGF